MVRSLGRVAPEFDLTSNRALRDLCGQPGIEDEFIGYLDGLAHTAMVAICYQPGKPATRGFVRSVKVPLIGEAEGDIGEAEDDIVNCESVPGKTGSLSVSSYSSHSMMAIHYIPLRRPSPSGQWGTPAVMLSAGEGLLRRFPRWVM